MYPQCAVAVCLLLEMRNKTFMVPFGTIRSVSGFEMENGKYYFRNNDENYISTLFAFILNGIRVFEQALSLSKPFYFGERSLYFTEVVSFSLFPLNKC